MLKNDKSESKPPFDQGGDFHLTCPIISGNTKQIKIQRQDAMKKINFDPSHFICDHNLIYEIHDI